jgi:hypothetical protein
MASVELASYDAQPLRQVITILSKFRDLLAEHAETIRTTPPPETWPSTPINTPHVD